MEIILAKSAGFCFGVKRAVECVYNEVEKGKIYLQRGLSTTKKEFKR